MRRRIRPILIVFFCVATVIAAGLGLIVNRSDRNSEPVAPVKIILDHRQIADAGLLLANTFTGEVRDPSSLEELRAAILKRGRDALAAKKAELASVQNSPNPRETLVASLHFQIGTLLTYEGRFDEAIASIQKALAVHKSASMPTPDELAMRAYLGIVAFRRGEVDNCVHCVGPSSCILPITQDAVHTRPDGSRQAIEHLTTYLKSRPDDPRVRWILNVAYMTLGEYPEKVPPQYLIPLNTLESSIDVGTFQNVAPLVGLISRGPNQAGGSIFDDFTGDGLPDLFITSLDADRGASLFVNLGNGKFEDCSKKAGLGDQVYALNVARADFDNDGNLDVVLLRGGWETSMRLSLLQNLGNSTFEDVTIASGLAEPISSEAAAWGDYDNDGLVDLFVSGEYLPPFSGDRTLPNPRNLCRLYHNEGNGTFVNVAASAGVAVDQCSKGCAWGDYDGDGWLDLFVSNFNAPCRLYHNEGGRTFRDVTLKMGVTGPDHGFACWFWDFDNDGRLDLYVNDYTSTLAEFVADTLVAPALHSSRPQPSRSRLYRNEGTEGFREVTHDVWLDRKMMPMGCNFADIDNDGFLDIYLGTGRMALEVLVPNLMFKNDAGQRFHDVTVSSGTGHLQKGHGISFADFDCDGDLDLFVVAGGAVPGDRAYNVLFENPGQGRHWLKVKLVGRQTNRAALGAHITAVVEGTDGKRRSIHRTVGNNGSFGGNSLVESIGLLDATSVSELVVFWPTSRITQMFRNITADQAIEITEGSDVIMPYSQPWVGGKLQ